MTVVELAVERIASEAAGAEAEAATPVLIAHGLFGSGRNWAGLARRFAAERPTAVVDLRNHGSSPWTEAMDYPSMGADLAAAAERAFGRPAVLLGHSMGGKTAMAAALTRPEQARGVIIVDIAPIDYAAAGREGDDHLAYLQAMRSAPLGPDTRRRDVEAALADAVSEPGLRAFLVQNLVMTPGAAPRWRLNLDVLERALPTLMGWPPALSGARFAGPAYALHGGASAYVDDAGRAALRAAFPSVAIERMEGAGHWLHAERPDDAAAAIQAALRRIDRGFENPDD